MILSENRYPLFGITRYFLADFDFSRAATLAGTKA
jgi:hypothetical protein